METVDKPVLLSPSLRSEATVQGPIRDLALHTLGWKAFQDLCSQVCEEVLKLPVSIYREAQDGGQDAVFLTSPIDGKRAEGTVQCKFTGNSNRRLRASDLNAEIDSIRELVAAGKAQAYYLVTNMGVDAPIAAEIKNTLRQLGVVEPEVFGREWITLQIRESSRLRALVPRVYGLGDLSIILDERRADQTRALLGHLMPSLGVYVPTSAHRSAVRVLSEHGIVLLLGAPATGKSMLAAILATTALDGEGHRCFQLDGPDELVRYWNPNEKGGFYWIDDAFGPNQLRSDYVDTWIAIMNKVKAAIANGNRFVLTSRVHIWQAATAKLGTRNHPLFASREAIVNVGALSPEEREQILYNHIKAGNQTIQWKSTVKPYLQQAAQYTGLLPEIARRLGSRSYTAGIATVPKDLISFVANPMEFLIDSIRELSDSQQAALTLVFLHRSRLPCDISDSSQTALVAEKFGVSSLALGDALEQLNESFLVVKPDASRSVWAFAHPTISDALSALLVHRPDLVELYVRGTKIETLLDEVVCEGAPEVRDAVVVPASANDLLVSRLIDTPDEPEFNRALLGFLCERASESVLRSVTALDKDLLSRQPSSYWRLSWDTRVRLFARIHSLGLLPTEHREEIAEKLEFAVLNEFDGSFLDNDEILALFQPRKLLALSSRLSEEVFIQLSDEISRIVEDADLDCKPEDNFSDIRSFVESLKEAFTYSSEVKNRLIRVEDEIVDAVRDVTNRKRDDDVEWEGEDVQPSKVTVISKGRSIFSDVDEY